MIQKLRFFLSWVLVFAFAGNLLAQASSIQDRFEYRIHLERAHQEIQRGFFDLAEAQIDTAEVLMRSAWTAQEPRRAEIHRMRAYLGFKAGDLEKALLQNQKAIHRISRDVDPDDIHVLPQVGFNRFDTLLMGLLIEKSKYLEHQSVQAVPDKESLRLAESSCRRVLDILKDRLKRGYSDQSPKQDLNLLKQVMNRGLSLMKSSEQAGLEPGLDFINDLLNHYYPLRNALVLRYYPIQPSPSISDSLFSVFKGSLNLVNESREDYHNWLDTRGGDNLQSVILKENIQNYHSEWLEILNRLNKLDSAWKEHYYPEAFTGSCIHENLRYAQIHTKDEFWFVFQSVDTLIFWKHSNSKLRAQTQKLFQADLEDNHALESFRLYLSILGPAHSFLHDEEVEILPDHWFLSFPFPLLYASIDLSHRPLFGQNTRSKIAYHPIDFCKAPEDGVRLTEAFAEEDSCVMADPDFLWIKPKVHEEIKGGNTHGHGIYSVSKPLPVFQVARAKRKGMPMRLLTSPMPAINDYEFLFYDLSLEMAGVQSRYYYPNQACFVELNEAKAYFKNLEKGLGKRVSMEKVYASTENQEVLKAMHHVVRGNDLPLRRPLAGFGKFTFWLGLSVLALVLLWWLYRKLI